LTSDHWSDYLTNGQPLMGQTRFEFFQIQGSDLPMTWDQMKAPVRGQHDPDSSR